MGQGNEIPQFVGIVLAEVVPEVLHRVLPQTLHHPEFSRCGPSSTRRRNNSSHCPNDWSAL